MAFPRPLVHGAWPAWGPNSRDPGRKVTMQSVQDRSVVRMLIASGRVS
jgi:hypothetical protein